MKQLNIMLTRQSSRSPALEIDTAPLPVPYPVHLDIQPQHLADCATPTPQSHTYHQPLASSHLPRTSKSGSQSSSSPTHDPCPPTSTHTVPPSQNKTNPQMKKNPINDQRPIQANASQRIHKASIYNLRAARTTLLHQESEDTYSTGTVGYVRVRKSHDDLSVSRS